MLQYGDVLGAVVPLGNGYFQPFKKDGDTAIPLRRSNTTAGAAVILWNATHPVRWGDVR